MPCTITNFHLAECVLPRPRSISGRQNVFHHVPGRFSVCRVCSATSRVDFLSTEYVSPHPGSISSGQRVFRHFLDRFPVGRVCSGASRVDFWVSRGCSATSGRRVCSATSRVDFWSAECVPLRPGSISGRQSGFHHARVKIVQIFEIRFEFVSK